jgi:hypothetical protein
MSIELTAEQAQAVAAEGDSVIFVDPHTRQAYRLVREEVYQRVQALSYDDSEWTPDETARLAGAAFNKLDDDDYSHYLQDNS